MCMSQCLSRIKQCECHTKKKFWTNFLPGTVYVKSNLSLIRDECNTRSSKPNVIIILLPCLRGQQSKKEKNSKKLIPIQKLKVWVIKW